MATYPLQNKPPAQWTDINASFSVNSEDILLYDIDAIIGAMINVLTCPLGTRAWLPEFGSLLPQLLWEPVDNVTVASIRTAIFKSLTRWEPRITLNVPQTTIIPLSTGDGYQIQLAFTIKATGQVGSANFQFTR